MLIDLYIGVLLVVIVSNELIKLKDKIGLIPRKDLFILKCGRVAFDMRLTPHILVSGSSAFIKTLIAKAKEADK